MKPIEYDDEMLWPTIIINEGTPYVLKRSNRKGINNPCELCDLRLMCDDGDDYTRLTELCTSDDRDEAWYFEEDWTLYNKKMSEFLNENSMETKESLEEERRIKDLTLKHDL